MRPLHAKRRRAAQSYARSRTRVSAHALDASWGGAEKGAPSHEALLSAGKIVIEELLVPDELAGRRVFLTAFPVLLSGCGGAWARAVAWELA